MKKIIILLLSIMMVLSLVACGGSDDKEDAGNKTEDNAPLVRDDNPQGSENQPLNRDDAPLNREESSNDSADTELNFSDVLKGDATEIIWSQQDEATKQQMIEEAQAEGVDLTFDKDGTMTIVDTNGDVMIQNPDGSWTYQDADGTVGAVGGGWPDNEYTQQVPKAPFEVLATSEDASGLSILFDAINIEELKAYTETVKKAGYTENVESEDLSMDGMVIFTYGASNSNGWRVEIFTAAGNNGMIISKAE